MSDAVQLLGIRHHGPGSARSVVRALDARPPSVLLVEGPPEAEGVLALAADEEMQPPVALLLYAPKEPRRAVWYPLAEFSPEWQAIRWALARDVPVRFIDLPAAVTLADPEPDPDADDATDDEDEGANDDGGSNDDARSPRAVRTDPLGQLAAAAGYSDAERWWEDVVEHREASPFEQIADAMAALRADAPPAPDQEREDRREAQMRLGIRAALADGFDAVTVVCGAWHVPALATLPPVSHDRARLKGLAKVPVAATWVPWTNGRLARRSGYGAGVTSPGWYHHVFASDGADVVPAWLARTTRLLRERDLDAPTSSAIDATRLTDALAALRGRPAPGLEEVLDASLATVCGGAPERLQLIRERLVVGEVLGSVPEATPSVPIAKDLEREQKRLRLRPEALAKVVELDLRKPTGLDRSHLLRRLRVLGVNWGTPQEDEVSSRGTFREVWELEWRPELALSLIDASRYGTTIAAAATARVVDRSGDAERLVALTSRLEACLDADLPVAVRHLVGRLEERAAIDRDAEHLLEALPPLARVLRYGSVRAQDTTVLEPVVAGMLGHAAAGLPLACASLDDAAAARMSGLLSEASSAVGSLGDPGRREVWMAALARLADQGGVHGQVAGRVVRLLLDGEVIDADDVARRLSLALSIGTPPADAAAWLEGFLAGSGLLLVHDERLLALIDDWITAHDDDTFTSVVPLLRRAFSAFAVGERRAIGSAARTFIERGGPTGALRAVSDDAASDDAASDADLDDERGTAALAGVRALLGLTAMVTEPEGP